jgi:hypothetical protein
VGEVPEADRGGLAACASSLHLGDESGLAHSRSRDWGKTPHQARRGVSWSVALGLVERESRSPAREASPLRRADQRRGTPRRGCSLPLLPEVGVSEGLSAAFRRAPASRLTKTRHSGGERSPSGRRSSHIRCEGSMHLLDIGTIHETRRTDRGKTKGYSSL